MFMFTSGYVWLDLIYVIAVVVGTALFIFKPFKEKTKKEIKESKRKVSYWSKYGRSGYVTKGQKDFEAKYWVWGFLVSFFLIGLPWIVESIGWL